MGQIRDIHKQIRAAVEQGTDQVESFHKQIASMPLNELEKIAQLQEPVRNIRQFQETALSGFYGFVRSVNDRVNEAAEMIVNQIEPEAPAKKTGAGTGTGSGPA